MTTDSSWAKGYAAGKASTQGELTWHREEIGRLRAALQVIADGGGLSDAGIIAAAVLMQIGNSEQEAT